jgi:miniconductance mechanosensitive channel
MEKSTGTISVYISQLEAWLLSLGISGQHMLTWRIVILLIAITLISIIANFVAKKIIVVGATKLFHTTKNTWDDYLIKHKVFHKLSHLAPALIIQNTIHLVLFEQFPSATAFIEKLTYIYILIIWLVVCSSLLEVLHDLYLQTKASKSRPIKGYIQLVRIIIYIIGGVAVISILINKNPMNLIIGMGASAAIITLIFKDTILGFVASIQVSANNMVKPGDWIEMPSRNADGTVLEISLNTVKVQNWDRTISTIPTYCLVSESFTNWKGMEESDGRRIKRSIFIDMRSVRFCTPELIEKLKRIHYVRDYIESRSKEIEEYNSKMSWDITMPVNGRRLTNLGIFRKYLEAYLQHNPRINTNATCMVRQLQPTERGIPIEVYCFSAEKAWVVYEGVQADLFDHILSIVPEFELRMFQNPSGDDFQSILRG